MEINFEEKYVLNPKYTLKNDKHRIILLPTTFESSSLFSFLHPMIAIMLSFFKGQDTLKEIIKKMGSLLKIEEEKLILIIKSFVNNDIGFCMAYDGAKFWIPEKILINNVENIERKDIEAEKFIIFPPYDFKTIRLNVPARVNLVLTTQCITNCIYCYADRKTSYKLMPLERALELIDEAAQLEVHNFDLSGGEIFLYEGWNILLKKIFEKGFSPFISTKFPLTEQQIDLLYETGARKIQVSLDSIIPSLLRSTLRVSGDYCEQIQKTIIKLDRKGFSLTIRSTLTRETCTSENIKSLIEFISTLANVHQYDCMPAGYSLYKNVEDFNRFKPTIDQLINIKNLFEQLNRQKYSFYITYDDSIVTDGAECCCIEAFDKRTMCTGNIYGMVILPDGKVTICEQLYWNEHFLIGDVMKNSLLDVWQSRRAESLWKLNPDKIPSDSSCRGCKDFKTCRYQIGTCWKEVIATYGKEHWYYPDIHCTKAPKPLFPVFFDNSFMGIEEENYQ